MKDKISLSAGIFWVLAWFATMLVYTFLDVAIWRRLPPVIEKFLNTFSIMLCTIIFLFLLAKKNNTKIEFFRNTSWQGLLIAAGCSVLFFLFLDHFLDPLLSKAFPSSEENYQEALTRLSKAPVLSLIQICIISPILEETLMRYFLLGGLSIGYGKWFALLISALLFAILHINLVQSLSAFVCGIVLGLLYLHTGSLFCCIFSHMGYNLLAYLTTVLPLFYKK